MHTRSSTLFMILSLILVACNMPAKKTPIDINQLATFAAQTQIAAGTTAAETTEVPAASTAGTAVTRPAAVSPTQTGTPCNRASFVGETVPDNTNFIVQKPFNKVWQLKNEGSCTWTSAYQLIFDSGERMNGPLSQPLTTGSVAPGETVEISVNLTAPALAGTYRGNWKIKDEKGEVFALSSGPFWVQIQTKRGGVVVWYSFKQGDSAQQVNVIQYLLRHHGYTNLAVDGMYGAETNQKVRNFQNKSGITDEENMVGPETWEQLIVTVSQGSAGEAVKALQFILNNQYGYTLEVDGIFGALTAEAVKDFQSKHGLTPNGVADPLTWQKLVGKP
ncbi:MAG: peptidoglycan-binding protein [Chloroflexi bacterium]|nr:peptidoglycan-binding protein [Chloroflexota bacterium]